MLMHSTESKKISMKELQNKRFGHVPQVLGCLKQLRYLSMLFLIIAFGNQVAAQTQMQGIAPVQNPQIGFGVDGDAIANYKSPGIYSTAGDWFSSPDWPGPGTSVFNMSTPDPFDLNYPMSIHYNDEWGGLDQTVFTSSTKVNDPYGVNFTFGPGHTPNKNDINNVTTLFSWGDPNLPGGVATDLWCIFAADRYSNKGDAYIDFEFLQAPLTAVYVDPANPVSGYFSSAGLDGTRTVGDILITIQFQNGGVAANPVIHIWEEISTGVFSYVQHDISEFTGDIYLTSNTEVTTAPWMPFGQTQYLINQYAEGAVNLTKIMNIGENDCGYISTVFVRTKTSQSITAELKDFPGQPYQVNINLNEIIVNCPAPVTVPACSSDETIQAAYTAWRNGFSYSGGVGVVDPNIDDDPPVGLPLIVPANLTDCDGGVLSFTYSVNDECNHPATCQSTFTVDPDITAPTASNPDPVTVQCMDDVPLPDINIIDDEADDCGIPVVAFVSDVQGTGACPVNITRTYSVTDECGHQILVTQIITVDDNTAPVLAAAPAPVTVSCIKEVPTMTRLAWTDNCDDGGTVLGVDGPLVGGTCGGTITRTWNCSCYG